MSDIQRYNPDTKPEVNKVEKIKLDDFDMDYFKSLEGENG